MRRRMFMLPVTAVVILLVYSYTAGQSYTVAQDSNVNDLKISKAIEAVLFAQRDAWNRGDITGFMDGYERSPKTVFVSGDSITHGWQTVLERYQKNYSTRAKMGTLTYTDLEITSIGRDRAVVIGSWRLKRASDEPHGKFTLIFRRSKSGWKIVHDHTSSS